MNHSQVDEVAQSVTVDTTLRFKWKVSFENALTDSKFSSEGRSDHSEPIRAQWQELSPCRRRRRQADLDPRHHHRQGEGN